MSDSIIVYRYDTSPFSHKLRDTLLLKGIPQRWVTVSNILPRPEITSLLGIGHRRIPVAAIGRDVYIDTSLIASVVERRFPTRNRDASPGAYRTLFPPRKGSERSDAGLIRLFVKNWVDSAFFRAVIPLIPWLHLPDVFLKDRGPLLSGLLPAGTTGDVDVNALNLAAARPAGIAALSAQLQILEEQLADGREWLFDTQGPSYADVAAVFPCRWAKRMPGVQDELFCAEQGRLPSTVSWMARVEAHLEALQKEQPDPVQLSGDEAAKEIVAGEYEPEEVVGLDEVEAKRLGFQRGDVVAVVMDGPGNVPTSGALVALNKEEIVLEVTGEAGVLRVHFPRVDYTAKKV
ncbi:Glutathione s-transferase [Mycena kentingensis (nom. inval.)]|nr:Glutathione s-transferase [Mycena kentingensis (nom. inval.)]